MEGRKSPILLTWPPVTGRPAFLWVYRLLISFSIASSCQQVDVVKMLAELRPEREQVNDAIAVLERLLYKRGKHRGRPPAWMTAAKLCLMEARISRRLAEITHSVPAARLN